MTLNALPLGVVCPVLCFNPLPSGHWVTYCQALANSKLALVCTDGKLRIIDTQTQQLTSTITFNASNVQTKACAYSPDSNEMVIGVKKSLCIINLNLGTVLPGPPELMSQILSCAYSPCGQFVAVGGVGGDKKAALRVFHLALKREVFRTLSSQDNLNGHLEVVSDMTSVRYLSDDRILSTSCDGKLRIWSPRRGSRFLEDQVIGWHRGQTVFSCAISPSKKWVVSANGVGTLGVWSLQEDVPTAIKCLYGHASEVIVCEISSNGRYLLSGSHDKTLRLWNTSTWNAIAVLEGHTDRIVSARFLSNSRFVISTGTDGNVFIWDLSTLVDSASHSLSLPPYMPTVPVVHQSEIAVLT